MIFFHKTNRLLICKHFFVVLFFGVLTNANANANAYAQSAIAPKKLAIYYGWPSLVNGANGNVNAAVDSFNDYDVVVFGDSLEFPQHIGAIGQIPDFGCDQNSHRDHDATQQIINLLKPKTKVYGYVSIGGEKTARQCYGIPTPTPLTVTEMKARINAWAAMGVAGIFLDEAEYGFGSTRTVQNTIEDYIHRKSLKVFINGFNPDHIFGTSIINQVHYGDNTLSTVNMNPKGVRAHLGPDDTYLLEHYQIINGTYVDVQTWLNRTNKAAMYKQKYGIKVATISTQADVNPINPDCSKLFDEDKFNYAWWSTLLYGFDYMAWGEPSGFSSFGSCSNTLPLHARPILGNIGRFVSPVLNDALNAQIYYRDTTAGVIEVDTDSHTGGFYPN